MLTYNIDNPDSTFIIEAVSNGYLIHSFNPLADSVEYSRQTELFINEFDMGTKSYWQAITAFLWGLLDTLEIYNSDHYPARLEIKVIKQKND